MKAEERHRLQENELRRLAEHARFRAQPFFDRYGTTLLLALAAVLVVVAVVIWWVRSRDADRGVGWDALAAAFRKPNASAEDFADVAELYAGTNAAVWARLYEGEARLASGIEFLFSDREVANRDLADARKAFEAALDSPDAGSEVTVRALYGLARTLEATSNGDLKPAIERYEQIAADYPGTVYETLAQERLEALKSPAAKAFYAWFSKQKPALPTSGGLSRPQDRGMPPGFSLPGLSSPGLPETSAGGGPETTAPSSPIEAPRPTAGSIDAAPATGERPAAAESPAATAPESSDAPTNEAVPETPQ